MEVHDDLHAVASREGKNDALQDVEAAVEPPRELVEVAVRARLAPVADHLEADDVGAPFGKRRKILLGRVAAWEHESAPPRVPRDALRIGDALVLVERPEEAEALAAAQRRKVEDNVAAGALEAELKRHLVRTGPLEPGVVAEKTGLECAGNVRDVLPALLAGPGLDPMQLDLQAVPIAVSAHDILALHRDLNGEPFGVPEKRGIERGLGKGVRRPRICGDVDDKPPVLQRREPGRQVPHEPVQQGDRQRGRLRDLPGGRRHGRGESYGWKRGDGNGCRELSHGNELLFHGFG